MNENVPSKTVKSAGPNRSTTQVTSLDESRFSPTSKKLEIVGVQTVASFVSVPPPTAMDEYYERHVLLFGRHVKVKLLLRPASIHIRNVGNPGDTIPSSRIGLLSHRADLCISGRDRCKKTANEGRRRSKNRSPYESEMTLQKRKRGREF